MTEREHEALTPEELEAQTAEALPEREQLSVMQPFSPFGGGLAIPDKPEPDEPDE